MLFRIRLPIELERPQEEFSVNLNASIDIVYHGGRWRGQCQDPPAISPLCETLEQALVATAKEIIREAGEAP